MPKQSPKKKISPLDGDVWSWEIKKKTRKKQKLRNELFKGLRLPEVVHLFTKNSFLTAGFASIEVVF